MSKLRLIVAIVALAIPLTALPAGAQEEPVSSIVAGSIVLPEGAVLPDDAVVLVSVDDTSRADAPAITLSRLAMQAPGAGSPMPFARTVLPVALDAHPVLGPLDITINVRIESAEGTLLYINDTAIVAVDAEGPLQGIVVPVITVEAS
jgi:putative lipoprotein